MSNSSLLARAACAALIAGGALSAHAQAQAPQTPRTPAPGSTSPSAAGDAATISMAFKQADTNGDGKLSNDELGQFPALASRFVDLDKNKDGFVSSDEFSTGVTVKAN